MNAPDVLKYGHKTVLDTLQALPPEADWGAGGVCGVWSVRDILAHLASYELALVDVLKGFLGAEPGPHLQELLQQGARFNEIQVGRRQGLTPAEALAEYTQAYQEVQSLAPQISPEACRQVGSLPWYGAEYSLDDLIVYQYYAHKREHCAQINVYRDRLEGKV